jgi:AraC-like DNA-binding protein
MIGQKYQWQGFDFIPTGCLLEQVIDLSQDMGFAHERSTKFYKDFHTHDRLMLIFPRGSSLMEVRTKNPNNTYQVNYETVLFVPKELEHDDEGISAIYDTMAFYPSDNLLHQAIQKFNLNAEQILQLKSRCFQIPRTELLGQIAEGYFLERVLLNEKGYDQEAVTFLGRRLLEEALLVAFFPEKEKSIKTKSEEENKLPVCVRALRFVEANLFEPISLDDIAKHSYASVSTLLRHFKTEVGTTPYDYIKNRRLEEALRLLKTGQHPVGDVALLVGYESFGAFSEAFKEKFGNPPSFYRNENSTSPNLSK